MTKLFLILILILILIPSVVFGDDLVCDPQSTVIAYDVVVDGLVDIVGYPAETDGSISYNIDAYGDGDKHVFIIIPIDISGWRGPVSDPFDARKPAKSGGVRIEP
jgi:hypothetical protein